MIGKSYRRSKEIQLEIIVSQCEKKNRIVDLPACRIFGMMEEDDEPRGWRVGRAVRRLDAVTRSRSCQGM
jgi:hypothetical protein